MAVVRSDEAIEELQGRALDVLDRGSEFPGMSYEEGVIATLDWLTGNTDESPMNE